MTAFFRSLLLATALLATQGAVAQVAVEPPAVEENDTGLQGPPPPLPDLSDPNSRSGEALSEPGPASGIPKTLRSSASKSGGPANELNPGGRSEEPPLPKADLAKVIDGKELFHGNYCGAGQRGEGLPPTDDLDAACKRHDDCYDTAGYRSCACDARLKREAARVSEQPGISRQIRERAVNVSGAADVMACQSP